MMSAPAMDRRRFPFPQRTTARAGVLLLVSGVLLLLQAGAVTVPVTETFLVPLHGAAFDVLAALTRAAALVLLAVGSAGELGIVAHSRSGRVALIVWGARDLVSLVIEWLPITFGTVIGYVLFALQLVFAAAALVAAVQVIRVRVLWGPARWAFLPIAIVDCFFIAIVDPPPFAIPISLAIVQTLAVWPTQFIEPMLTLAAAIALLAWGRTEALRLQGRRIHDAW